MAEFDTAKYIDMEITPKEYQDDMHRNMIYCPECELAPLHIVIRQKGEPFFKSNRKEEHKPDCQHYRDFINSRELKRLTKNIDLEDKERLKFLVETNILSAIRLLKGDRGTDDETLSIEKSSSEKKPLRTKSGKIKHEHIPRIHTKNLFRRKSEFIDEYVLIYGSAKILVKKFDSINRKTNEKFAWKKIEFRSEQDKFLFSINLTSNQSNYLNISCDKKLIKFAVFGKLIEINGFISLKIITTSHLETLC